jgi:[ribosomal protein S5]-alanine N-acetyltransferase
MKALEQPVLIANRYRLRPFEWRDAALIQEASKDPLIPLISTVPSCGSHTAAVEFIERQHHRLVERSGYSFAIVDSSTGQASGQIGLWLKNANDGRASIGYWIGPNHRKRGAATAALAALSEWGLTRPGIHRLELYVEPWNEGSWRTAERCGYAREGLMRSW